MSDNDRSNVIRDMSPRDLGFDYDDWYPYQLENIQKIVDAKEAVTLMEAPTGCGKSLTAMAAAKAIPSPRDHQHRTVILCSTKNLQRQYMRDFEDHAVIMMGRSNFQCALDRDFSCAEAPCSLEGFGCTDAEKYNICPYYIQKRLAARSPIVISNSSFFLHESNYVGQFSNLDLLVVDEGDLLERDLLNFASIELSRQSFGLSDIDLPDLSSVWAARAWAKKSMSKVSARAMESDSEARRDISYLRDAIRLRGQAKKLAQLSAINADEWVIQGTMFGYSIQPLWAASFGASYVRRHAEKLLVMSATMPPPDVYTRQLGITKNGEPVQYIEIPSFFPAENRPVNFWPVVKLKGAQMQDYQLNQLVNAIDIILRRFPNDKGIVHTVSYKLRDAILRRTAHRDRFISHNEGGDRFVGREEALSRYVSSEDPLVLISPSMGRGVDLRDDLARFAICAKMPYLSLGNEQVKARMKKDPDWYTAATADELVQSFGRVVRSVNDYGVGFLIDDQEWFFRKNKDFFPDWWRDGFHKIEGIEGAVLPPQMI